MTKHLSKIDDNVLYFDTETRQGDKDEHGNYINAPIASGATKYLKYAEGCIMVTYAFGHGPVKVWENNGYVLRWEEGPDDLRSAIVNPKVQVRSHNVLFDRRVLQYCFGIKIYLERWYCTMGKAYSNGLPGSLAGLGAALDLPPEMLKKAGWQLMKLFCTPNPDPWVFFEKVEKWHEFIDYAVHDITAMRECDLRMPEVNYQKMRDSWLLDQKINDRGLPIDKDLCNAVIEACDKEKDRVNEEIELLTGGEVKKITQSKVMLEHLKALGVDIEDLTKASVKKAIKYSEATDNPYVLQLLLARQRLGKSSVAKYQKMLDCEIDGLIYDSIQWFGARTGRLAGRLVQIQNFARPELEGEEIPEAVAHFKNGTAADHYVSPTTTAASLCRAAIAAPPGQKFVVRDFSSIEGMGLAWLAGEEWKLDAYRNNIDVYSLAYSKAFGTPYDPEDKEARKIGKVMELALGYQGWTGAWAQWADAYGVKVKGDDAIELISGWRKTNSNIVKLWSAMEQTFLDVCNDRQTRRVGALTIGRPLEDYQVLQLPSGRFIMYYKPEIIETDRGMQFSYMGTNSYTRKWERLTSYGGKETENGTQGFAADVMLSAMVRADKVGIDIRATVHDEYLILADTEEAEVVNETMETIMATPDDWCFGLPLKSTGDILEVYGK